MRLAVFPLATYACLLGVLAVVLWVWDDHTLPPVMLTVAALLVGATVVGWLLWAGASGRAEGHEVRAVPDLSAATALLGFAIPTMLVGAYLGLYLVLIGGGLIVLAVGGLVREALATRRAIRRLHGD